jgi:hypothetical protein
LLRSLPLIVIASIAIPLHAGAISGTLSGDSTLTTTGSPGVFVQNFIGDGDDATFGSFTAASQSNIDFSKPPQIAISGGSLTETFSNGTLFGTSSGDGTASGQGTATVTVDFAITGGTGFFAGASGEVTASESITSTSPTTESITGSYTGSLTLAPEPGSLTLLAAGLGFLWRRRGAILSEGESAE